VTRRATIDDLDAVVATLVESHRDYVWETWALPGPDRELELERIYRLDVELVALPAGEVWVHDDGVSVAVWRPPDAALVDETDQASLDALTRDVLGDRCAVVLAAEEIIGARRPPGPCWYLGTMGTLSSRRREGCGTAVLRPVLEHLDAVGSSAYLETSLVTNVEFYERLGFEVFAHLEDLPGGAPATWVMRRSVGALASAGPSGPTRGNPQ
jgi:GNAT superfamily N-acetyltransferase